ncbi:MAG: CocE/NonD family hydrolase [Desulfobacterales bacterium]|nr:CocE/NonD family hydrolase [Desulfobacterales bacterium]
MTRNANFFTVYILLAMVCLGINQASCVYCADKTSAPFQYSGYSSQEYEGFTRLHAYVPMDGSSEYTSTNKSSEYALDGLKLAVTTYLPSGGPSLGQFPVILVYLNYSRESINPDTGEIATQLEPETLNFFTSHGYAVVMADKRGSGASSGSITNFSPEIGLDGKKVVDWIAEQSWCDGNVGMIGGSYFGWSQFATASQKPAALKCIIPEAYALDLYSATGHNPGGIYGRTSTWGVSFYDKNMCLPSVPIPALAWPSTPVVDEDGDGELVDEIPIDLNKNGTFLDDYNLPDNPPQYSDGNQRQHIYYLTTAEHLNNSSIMAQDMYFRDVPFINGSSYTFEELGQNDYPVGISESGIPVYNIGAWFDGFPRGTTQWYATLAKTNPSRLLIGPTNHTVPGLMHPLAVPLGPWLEYFGENPEEYVHNMNVERLRFLDRYLKGIENGIDTEPPVSIYVMNGEGWRSENEWPLERQVTASLYFDRENSLSLKRKTEGYDDYPVDFTHDSREAATGATRWNLRAPQQIFMRTDKDSKCLTYTSPSLKKDIEVTGHPIVHLWVSSTADHGDFFVYMEDVDENGNACFVTDGMLRAGFAGLVPNEDILPPGSGIDILPDLPWHGFKEADYVDGIFRDGNAVELVFDLMPTSWVFKEGHRIRVSIAGADWPMFKLHPKLSPTNDPADPNNIVPTVTVHREADYSSRIELPVIPKKMMKHKRALKWVEKHF